MLAGSGMTESFGVGACSCRFDFKYYAEEPDLIGAPVFGGNQCTAPFSFRYKHLDSNLSLVSQELFISTMTEAR
jgi:hypothetical protein